MTGAPGARHRVFVYGTLKEGFANARENTGTRLPGEYVTVRPYPLYLVGPYRLPWLVDAPGRGVPVAGELYEVDEAGLARMDRLEQVGEPGWYRRGRVLLRRLDAHAAAVEAYVYFGDPAALRAQPVHAGPLAAFTAEDDAAYRAL